MQLHYIIFDNLKVMEAAVQAAKDCGAVFFGDSFDSGKLGGYSNSLVGNGMTQEVKINIADPPVAIYEPK